MLQNPFRLIDRLVPLQKAYAHCDVPCGLYEADAAMLAADTIVKMVEKIQALPKDATDAATRNSFVRMIWTKEEHARKCKEELLILWSDFFKPEHLERFPDLHETFWKAAKLCSKAKQEVGMDTAKELKSTVEKIATMMAEARIAVKK